MLFRSILVNNYNFSYYLNDNKKSKTGIKFKNVSNIKFNSVLEVHHEEKIIKKEIFKFSDLIELKEIPLFIEEFTSPMYSAVLIVPESIFNDINHKMSKIISSMSDKFSHYNDFTITFNYIEKEEAIKVIDKYKEFDKNLYYFNVKEEQQMLKNILIVVNILEIGRASCRERV